MTTTTVVEASSGRSLFADTASAKSSTPSGPPPSYSRHQNDELLSPGAATTVRARRRIPHPRASIRRADPSLMLQVLTAPGPLELTMDNGLIYPPPPSNALYHLPRVLTWSGNEILLFRSLPPVVRSRDALPPRDLALYTMRRTPFTQEVALLPRREGLISAMMRRRKSIISGMSWEVKVKNEIALRFTKGRWKNENGDIVAEELSTPSQREVLTITGENLEINMKDLIVAAWATRLWQGNGRASLARNLICGTPRPRSPVMLQWRSFRDR